MVDLKLPWLGASPDVAVTDSVSVQSNGLLKIKYPNVARKSMTLEDYAHCKSSCLSPSTLKLVRSHAYYYQVQVAIHVAGSQWCDFCVWSPSFAHVESIENDDALIAAVLLKLKQFYFDHLLPALAASYS